MLEYDKIDLSKGTDFSKTNELRRCIICHYWYFLKINFEIQSKVCNYCNDLTQKAMNFNDVAIVSVKGNDYRIHLWYMGKDKAISVLGNTDLTEKKLNIIKLKDLLSLVKDE